MKRFLHSVCWTQGPRWSLLRPDDALPGDGKTHKPSHPPRPRLKIQALSPACAPGETDATSPQVPNGKGPLDRPISLMPPNGWERPTNGHPRPPQPQCPHSTPCASCPSSSVSAITPRPSPSLTSRFLRISHHTVYHRPNCFTPQSHFPRISRNLDGGRAGAGSPSSKKLEVSEQRIPRPGPTGSNCPQSPIHVPRPQHPPAPAPRLEHDSFWRGPVSTAAPRPGCSSI